MKKFLLLIAAVSLLFADAIHWQPDLKSALDTAQKTNKKLMILMSSQSCHYCKQMHEEVFSNGAIAEYINTHYIPLELDINEDAYPSALEVRGVPATFFFSSDLKHEYKLILGPRHPMIFMNILQVIADE